MTYLVPCFNTISDETRQGLRRVIKVESLGVSVLMQDLYILWYSHINRMAASMRRDWQGNTGNARERERRVAAE